MRSAENAARLAVELAEFMAPRAVFPIIRENEIILDDSCADFRLSLEEALHAVRECLNSSRIRYRRVYVEREAVKVDDLGGPSERPAPDPPLLLCPHCGYSTLYEDVYWVHVKSHGIL